MKISKTAIKATGLVAGVFLTGIVAGMHMGGNEPDGADDGGKPVPENSEKTAKDVQGLSGVVDTLKLPVGAKAYYYNKASDTALSERCELSADGDAVICTLRTMNNLALLDYTQTDIYTISGGRVQVASTKGASREWTPETHSFDFKPAVKAAPHVALQAGDAVSRAADASVGGILQNSVMELKAGSGKDVSACSFVPVAGSRGFSLCTGFNGTSGAVESHTVPVAAYKGHVATAGGAGAARAFDYQYDPEYQNFYLKTLDGAAKAYMLRQ